MVHRNTSRRSRVTTKTILRLPDLEQSKSAALDAIDEFIGWYCSEPRLAFSRTVVLRYRFFFEQRNLGTLLPMTCAGPVPAYVM